MVLQYLKKGYSVSLKGDNKELKKDAFLVHYFGFARETYTWDLFNEKVDAIASDNEDWYLVDAPLTDDDEIRLTQDGIWAELATLNIAFEPALFWLQF